MANLLISNSPVLPLPPATRVIPLSHVPSSSPTIRFSTGQPTRRLNGRGSTVVTRAGPNTSSYLFAFAVPFSLLAVTIFTSIKIADKLDRDFLEEVAINQAIREAEEESDDVEISVEEIVQEPVLPRTRNRPKREA